MPDNPLARKMKRKPGARSAILHAPAGYEAASTLSGLFDWIEIFVQNKTQLDELAPKAAKALKPGSILWIAFPQGQFRDPDRPDARPGLGDHPLARSQMDHVDRGE